MLRDVDASYTIFVAYSYVAYNEIIDKNNRPMISPACSSHATQLQYRPNFRRQLKTRAYFVAQAQHISLLFALWEPVDNASNLTCLLT